MSVVDITSKSVGASVMVGADGWPSTKLAWTTVGVLAIAQSVNAVDRHVINLLVEPIKTDLHITDTQVGLLLGFAFALFYTVMGLPIGRWADTYSRRMIIAIGALWWSAMTMACGLANSFVKLFFARMAVGAGEATLNPAGYSLISDYFPPERRAMPMGVFIMGHTIGSAITLFLVGAFIQYLVANNVTLELPTGAVLKSWQIAFVCAGLPGFLIALLILVIREPPRRELIDVETSASHPPRTIPVKQVVSYLATHAGVYVPIFAGFSLMLVWEMGKQLWAPTYFIRTFGWTPAQVGLVLGLMTLFFTSGGAVASGWVSEYLAKRGHRDANLRAAFLGCLSGLPFAIIATLTPIPSLALIAWGPAFFFGAFPFALAPAAISVITPNQMRAQTTALYLFAINLLGFGVGPAFIGALTDHVFRDENLLRYSMCLTAAIALPLALVFVRKAMTQYVRTIDELAAKAA